MRRRAGFVLFAVAQVRIEEGKGRTWPNMASPRMRVVDLKQDRPVSRLDLIVLRRYPRRMVAGDKFTGPMAAACARDNTGVVGLVLWGDDVDRVAPGTSIRLLRGWCRERDGSLVVSTGRHGRLVVLDAPLSSKQA